MINRAGFDAADLAGKIALMEAALGAQALGAEETLELLDVIHAELSARRGRSHQDYARYAALIEKLEHAAPDLSRRVMAAYNQRRARALEGVETGGADS